jgi:hypothetical protein
LRDLLRAQESDLGGAETLSAAEMVLVRRFSMLTLQLEMMEARFAQNDGEASAKQLDAYQRAANTLRLAEADIRPWMAIRVLTRSRRRLH